MAVSTPVRREFCRRLFRVGGATAALRHSFLDTLSDAAIAAQQQGAAISATSHNGASVQFQFFTGWQPADALELIDVARAWADCADVATALALLPDAAVTSFGHDFTLANSTGGAL